MQQVTVVIPALKTPWEIVDQKVLKLAAALHVRLDVVVYADSPALKRRYFFGTNPPVDARKEFEQSVEVWCNELVARMDRAGIGHDLTIAWGRRLEGRLGPIEGRERDALLVLVNTQRHMTQEYRAVVRHFRAPILSLYDNPWADRASVVAAVDPVHESDTPTVRDTRIVEVAKSLASGLSGRLMILHSCFVPPYLFSYRDKIESHHRENIRDFLEENGFERLEHSMVTGDPSSALRKYVHTSHADVLAMGSVARGFFDRDVIGSTAENMLADAPCDLLLVSDQH